MLLIRKNFLYYEQIYAALALQEVVESWAGCAEGGYRANTGTSNKG